MTTNIEHWRTNYDTKEPLLVVVFVSKFSTLLLGVQTRSGTGKLQAEACLATLDEWCIRGQVCGLVINTTDSNNGLNNGACTFIEQLRGRELAAFVIV